MSKLILVIISRSLNIVYTVSPKLTIWVFISRLSRTNPHNLLTSTHNMSTIYDTLYNANLVNDSTQCNTVLDKVPYFGDKINLKKDLPL